MIVALVTAWKCSRSTQYQFCWGERNLWLLWVYSNHFLNLIKVETCCLEEFVVGDIGEWTNHVIITELQQKKYKNLKQTKMFTYSCILLSV